MRAVQVEKGYFGDRKHGAWNIWYLMENSVPEEFFGNIL